MALEKLLKFATDCLGKDDNSFSAISIATSQDSLIGPLAKNYKRLLHAIIQDFEPNMETMQHFKPVYCRTFSNTLRELINQKGNLLLKIALKMNERQNILAP